MASAISMAIMKIINIIHNININESVIMKWRMKENNENGNVEISISNGSAGSAIMNQ
jgi:hypothetical protein